MTLSCKPLYLPFLLDAVVQHLVAPSLICYFKRIAWPSQLLLIVFPSLTIYWSLISISETVQFDASLKPYTLWKHSWTPSYSFQPIQIPAVVKQFSCQARILDHSTMYCSQLIQLYPFLDSQYKQDLFFH